MYLWRVFVISFIAEVLVFEMIFIEKCSPKTFINLVKLFLQMLFVECGTFCCFDINIEL